jgi:predicted nucleic acid-binding Zn ribbon protein
MGALPTLRTHCPSCGKALSMHERFSGGLCSDWVCRHQRLTAERRAALSARLQALRDAAALASGLADTPAVPVVRVRYYDTRLEPVPESQRQSLRCHLMALEPEVAALGQADAERADDALADEDDGGLASFPTDPQVDALLGQVCGRCTGYCCRLGFGRHAFLDAAALHRALRREPGLDHAALVARYLDALPALHHAGSCGFHGERGCVLARSQRASICNTFECPGLEQTRQLAEQKGVRRVFVVRHDDEHGPVGAFVPPA